MPPSMATPDHAEVDERTVQLGSSTPTARAVDLDRTAVSVRTGTGLGGAGDGAREFPYGHR